MTPISSIYFVQSPSEDPYYNLALEEYLFTEETDKEFVMLWQNRPSVIVGRYQNTAEEINREYIEENNITVARRMSGGGAVYHDLGNLNYTIIVNEGSSASSGIGGLEPGGLQNFADFARPVIRAMASFGVQAEFSGRNDIIAYPDPDMVETFCFSEENQPRKLSGCAQLSRNGRTLYHGCILVNSDLKAASAALRPNPAKYESSSVKSVRSRIATLADLADRPVSVDDFAQLLKKELAADFAGLAASELSDSSGSLVPYKLSGSAESEIAKLADEKYSAWQWNYGFYADYTVSRSRRFSFGTLTVNLTAEEGFIKAVKLTGDFFPEKDISGLEQALTGLPLDSNLKNSIEALGCRQYIEGLKAEDLEELLR